MAGIEWRDDSPDDVAAAFEDLPRVLESTLAEAAGRIANRLEAAAKQNAPKDLGGAGLAGSIRAVVESVSATVVEIRLGAAADHAAPMEFGTDPFFPPPDELRGWARRVLGADDPESAAFLVAREISETGIDEQPYLRPAFEDNLEFIVTTINEAVDRAFEAVGLR